MYYNIIERIFESALIINALLFIPQIVKIIREKSAEGVSLLTFGGFLFIQFSIVLHGILRHDWGLVAGYIFSMVTCGSVVLLVLIYGNGKLSSKKNK